MNKYKTTILYSLIPVLAVFVLFVPDVVFAGLNSFLYEMVHETFGWIVFAAAMVLDFGLNYFVVDYGANFNENFSGTVNNTWVIFRDLFNITFIFGLVYIGFKMILRTDDGNTKRWLASLVLAAILINFSLLFTKVIIDFSNILTIEIMKTNAEIFVPHDDTEDGKTDVTLSTSMQRMTNITTILSDDASQEFIDSVSEADSVSWLDIFLTPVLFLITAFVYFSAGILLITRGVVLTILMVVSPFLFLGMVLPMFNGFSRDLWKRLFSQAFLAPAYVAVLLIAMSIGSSLSGRGNFAKVINPASGADATKSSGDTIGTYLVVIVLMLASLAAAKRMSDGGSMQVLNTTQKVRRLGQQMLGQQSARLGRAARDRSLSLAADRVTNSRRLRNYAANGNAVQRYIAQNTLKASDSGAKGYRKVRNASMKNKERISKLVANDMDHAENKAAAANLATTNKASLQAQEARLNEELDLINDKSIEQLDSEINHLEEAIKTAADNIEKAKTTEDKEAAQKDKEAKENSLGSHRAAYNLKTTTNDLEQKREEALKQAGSFAAAAEKETDEDQKAAMLQASERFLEESAKLDAQVEQMVANYESERNTALAQNKKDYRNADDNAYNTIKYQNQQAYLETLENSAILKAKQSVGKLFSMDTLKRGGKISTIGSAVGPLGVAAGVAGTGIAAGIGFAGRSSAYRDKQEIKALRDKLGGSIEEMAENDKKAKKRKEAKAVIDELNKEGKDDTASKEEKSDDTK